MYDASTPSMNQVFTQLVQRFLFPSSLKIFSALDNERWEIYCGSSCSQECQRNFEIFYFQQIRL